jgi:hypothetical protein
VTLPEKIEDKRLAELECEAQYRRLYGPWWDGAIKCDELLALVVAHRERDRLREELKSAHETLCKIGGAVRFFFPDIPIAGDTVANIEAEAVKVKARIRELEARQRAIFDAGFKQARLMGDNAHHYCGDRADALFVGAMVRLEAELAKEQRDG